MAGQDRFRIVNLAMPQGRLTTDRHEEMEKPQTDLVSGATVGNPRSAREVIDEALSDNKIREVFLLSLAGIFVLVGFVVLVYSVINREPVSCTQATLRSFTLSLSI